MASTLLGTVPPRLPGRLLVAFAEEFGISQGTTRVALSRMVDKGELRRVDGGVYELAGALLDRQERQEAMLRPSVRPWRGDWEILVVRAGRRSSSERAAMRRAGLHLGMQEHREGVWLRPDNLDPERLPSARAVAEAQADRFVGRPDGDPVTLAASLFPLTPWAVDAARLVDHLDAMRGRLDAPGPAPLAEGFELAAAALRHLVADPLLPEALWPRDWPAPALREANGAHDLAFRRELSAFFRALREPALRPTLAS